MDLRSAQSLFQALSGDHCAFGYSGKFPDEHSARLIDLGSSVLESQGFGVVERGRLGYVMVEAYQNIVRHASPLAASIADKDGRSMFLVRCHDKGQQVVAMNAVTREQSEGLRTTLATLDGKTGSQLKELFLVGLQRAAGSASRGAGLGLIEMARRSGQPPGWEFLPVDDSHELFALVLRLGKEAPLELVQEEASTLHGIMASQGICMVQAGFRSPGVEAALLRLLETEVGADAQLRSASSRALLAAMGLMTRPNATFRRQVLILSQVRGRYSLLFGGFIDKRNAELLDQQARELATWEGSRLQTAYRLALLKPGTSSVPLGLIELARMNPEPLQVASFASAEGHLVLIETNL
ncbi:MAG: SiaB family protein kinase [Flavobacteriales bacterium]